MRLEQDSLSKIKTIIHGAQAGTIALAWILTIVVFTRDGPTDGRTAWYFGLVSHHFLSLVIFIHYPSFQSTYAMTNIIFNGRSAGSRSPS